MAGGLLQLVAYGAQDMYLTNNPQITFFKVMYRRHTNFAYQPIERGFEESLDFGKKGKTKIYRLGDLSMGMTLRVKVGGINGNGAKFAWIRRLGHAMIKQVEINIGGIVIDKHYGTWLDIWYELTKSASKEEGYNKMIGDVDSLTLFNANYKPEYTIFVPLQFWFNRHVGLALPLIAIQYHDIFVNIEFEKKENLIVRCADFTSFDQVKILDCGLITDFVYLDIEERKRYADISHEYLIEQVQTYYDESVIESPKRLALDFSSPTKELIWVMRNGNYTSGKSFLCYSNKEDWTDTIFDFSKTLLKQSTIMLDITIYETDDQGNVIVDDQGQPIVLVPEETPPDDGEWEKYPPGYVGLSNGGNFDINNQSLDKNFWININSLMVSTYSITNTLSASFVITQNNIINITILEPLLDKDISYPTDIIIDTRLDKSTNVCVFQFSNYGVFITGTQNPLAYALLEFNSTDRVEKRNGSFFGDLQPYIHHNSTPIDGINLYSFAIEPEKHQPSGSANLSRIENVILTLWLQDTSNSKPPLPFYNFDNKLFIYGFSYNIFRITSGVTGLSYNG